VRDHEDAKYYARLADFAERIDIAVINRLPNGTREVALPLKFEAVPRDYIITTPTAQLSMTQAQYLMDQLWTCGLRPSEGTGSAGAMAATQKHLEDMQAIAIGLLRRDGVDL
jgi:hypothetical protein